MTDAQKRVLLVEDDSTLSGSLATLLTDAGFAVTVAHDGEEGVKLAEEVSPHIILLDVMLPKVDGVTALRRIKQIPGQEETPVMMLTNRDDLEVIEETLKGGSYDFLVKHEWKLEDIVQRIQDKVGESQTKVKS